LLNPFTSSCNVEYVYKSGVKLITFPSPYLSMKAGESVDPPDKETRNGHLLITT
jgi:hypothetical protein